MLILSRSNDRCAIGAVIPGNYLSARQAWSAALQVFAIAAAIAVVRALHPIYRQCVSNLGDFSASSHGAWHGC